MTIQQANAFISTCVAKETPKELVQKAFAALGCAEGATQYLPVAGAAGKSTVATLAASILQVANFANVGCYVGGALPLRARITIGGKAVPSNTYVAAVATVQQLAQDATFFASFVGGSVAKTALDATPLDQDEAVAAEFGFTPMRAVAKPAQGLSAVAAEFLVASLCFTKSNCQFAAFELATPSYATLFAKVPVCVIGQLAASTKACSGVVAAKEACAMLRKGAVAITSPAQPADALAALQAQAEKIGCKLVVPALDDFTEKPHHALQNRMDYGGYEVMLPYLGQHAAHNAAMAIELALAVDRTGYEISDDAILEGLSLAQNTTSVLPVQYAPAVVVDACHTPLQAVALAQWVKEADYQAVSLVIGFVGDVQEQTAELPQTGATAEHGNIEGVLSALETGVIVDPDNPEKGQLPGMADNAFDKVYAVTPLCANALSAQAVVARGKFHFDVVACASLAEALANAQADAKDAIVVCGCEAIALAAKEFLQ